MKPTQAKLQKLLAQAGIGSRREIETWIAARRITVNGKVAEIGQRVAEDARITLDKQIVWPIKTEKSQLPSTVWLYHKPTGEICSRKDPEGRRTVFSHLPTLKHQRWISIGRLDLNTSGLLLFTTDGELAQKLMHPKQEIPRVYEVRVFGKISPDVIKRLSTGVKLEDGPARFTHIEHLRGEGSNQWYRVTLTEGRNREVRRLWESQNISVNRLIRVQFGPINLSPRLKQGEGRFLSAKETKQLYSSV